MRSKIVKRILIGIGALLIIVFVGAKIKRVTPLAWGHKEVNTSMFSDEAINGYDAVAYFTKGVATKGQESFTYGWKDATWYFFSDENLDLFKADPEKYAPKFGGYCAFAVGKGFTANSDPNAFKIIDDKLYLCADQDILKQWLEGGEATLKESHKNWK